MKIFQYLCLPVFSYYIFQSWNTLHLKEMKMFIVMRVPPCVLFLTEGISLKELDFLPTSFLFLSELKSCISNIKAQISWPYFFFEIYFLFRPTVEIHRRSSVKDWQIDFEELISNMGILFSFFIYLSLILEIWKDPCSWNFKLSQKSVLNHISYLSRKNNRINIYW